MLAPQNQQFTVLDSIESTQSAWYDEIDSAIRRSDIIPGDYEYTSATSYGKLVKKGLDPNSEEFKEQIETELLKELSKYGIDKSIVSLSGWDKVCMFSLVYRSVMLIFGFLGIGLGLAIVTSGKVKSDLD